MNKDDFIEMTVNGGMIGEDRRVLMSLFDEDGKCTDPDTFMEMCLMKLQLQSSLRIQSLNKQIASAIHELGYIGQWTNLLQIHRSLPSAVKDSVQNDDESYARDITDWVERQQKWEGLSADQQRSALKYVDEQEWKVRNRNA